MIRDTMPTPRHHRCQYCKGKIDAVFAYRVYRRPACVNCKDTRQNPDAKSEVK